MAYTDDDLYEMSDEELAAAFKEAKANGVTVEDSEPDEFETDESDVEIDLEQPENEDSDDDASLETTEEDAKEEASEAADVESDETTEEADENVDADADKKVDDKQPVQDDEVLTFKADGQDYHFTVKEMKEQFGKVFGQAMNYTKKMQALKPHRKTIDALESANVSYEDLNLMIDVLKGNKDALAAVMKRTGIDALDIDTEDVKPYVPMDYGRDEHELEIKEIVDEIANDKEYVVTQSILQRQWDDKSRLEFAKDPSLIKALHIDVKTGMYDTINPIAQKMKIYEGAKRSDLEYYKLAANEYFDMLEKENARSVERQREETERSAAEARRLQSVKEKQMKAEAERKIAEKRKAAAPTKKVVSRAIDVIDDSDEAFEEWYNKLQEQQ